MKRAQLVLALAVAGGLLLAGSNVSAWEGGCQPSQVNVDVGSGMFNVWGFGYSGSLYGLGYIPVPPYFALHPPVYYGDRVFRSYGASPFAWRHEVPDLIREEQPEIILNPHVPAPAAPAPAEGEKLDQTSVSDKVVARPRMIINPFVEQAAAAEPRALVSR